MRPRLASWPLWWLSAQSASHCGAGSGRRSARTCRRGTARPRVPLRHRVALWPLPRLLIFFQSTTKAPLTRGFFLLLPNDRWQRLTNNDDASSGGASDGGDASPSAGDANDGGANPNAGDASPSAGGPSRDDGRGPSALLPA